MLPKLSGPKSSVLLNEEFMTWHCLNDFQDFSANQVRCWCTLCGLITALLISKCCTSYHSYSLASALHLSNNYITYHTCSLSHVTLPCSMPCNFNILRWSSFNYSVLHKMFKSIFFLILKLYTAYKFIDWIINNFWLIWNLGKQVKNNKKYIMLRF